MSIPPFSSPPGASVSPLLGDALYFGGGTDGALVITSSNVVAARDMYYSSISWGAGATGLLVPAGYQIFCSGILDLTNMPARGIAVTTQTTTGAGGNGGAGGLGGGAAGAAGISSAINTLGPGATGGTGGASSITTGAPGSAGGVGQNGGNGGAGATGGNGISNGGLPRVASAVSNASPIERFDTHFIRGSTLILSGSGGSGGSGGGGDATNTGGGGGGGGTGAGIIYISAKTINKGSSTPSIGIDCRGKVGGNGGTAATGNCGGGSGGGGSGGGWIYIAYKFLTGPVVTNLIDVSGGNGGAGGNGIGTGLGAGGGGSGANGRVTLINLTTNTVSETQPGTSVSGGLPSGVTGGTGGVATTVQVNL